MMIEVTHWLKHRKITYNQSKFNLSVLYIAPFLQCDILSLPHNLSTLKGTIEDINKSPNFARVEFRELTLV